jgi:GAF domain-containing protein
MGSSEIDGRIAEVLVQLGAVLHNEATVDRILQLVTELTERTVPSASAVSVTLIGEKGAYTSNASAAIARDLDEVQYRSDDGPCLEAIAKRGIVNAALSATGGEWPEFTRAAIDSGIGCVMSLPLAVVEQEPLGGLNIYSPGSQCFDDVEEATAALLAQQAAAVLANAVAFADVNLLNRQLVEALETRDLIGQAKGILMEREHCSSNEAFDILRRASQRTNRKLREIASDLVASASERTRPE